MRFGEWMKRTARAATRALVGPLAEVGRALVSVTSSIREMFGIVKRERFPPREPPRGPETPEPPPVGPEEPEGPEEPVRDGPIGPELPINMILIRGRPRGEQEGAFRGTFFFLEDVIEYAIDVPIQVRVYYFSDTYLVYISPDSEAVVPVERGYRHKRNPRGQRTFVRGGRWWRGVV